MINKFKIFLFISTLIIIQYPIFVLNTLVVENSQTVKEEILQDDISNFEVSLKNQSGRNVSYNVNYTEEDYWYIHQPEFVKPSWVELEESVYGWDSNGHWPQSVNTLDDSNNQSAFVEWRLYNGDYLVDSNISNLSLGINGSGNPPFLPNNTPPEGDPESPIEPEWTPELPIDGELNPTSASTVINIEDLALGWDYEFKATLKYVDSNGFEKTFSTYEDEFSTSKTIEPSTTVEVIDKTDTSLMFSVTTSDPQGARDTGIKWNFFEGTNLIQSGYNDSNFFTQKINNLNVGFDYSLVIEYDYSLSSHEHYFYDRVFELATEPSNKSEISYSKSNTIDSNSFYSILNVDNMYENPSDISKIGINYYKNGTIINSEELSKDEIKHGENLIFVEDEEIDNSQVMIRPYIIYNTDEKRTFSTLDHNVNLLTNIENDGSLFVKNAKTSSDSANVDFYAIETDTSEIVSIEYKFENKWTDFTEEFHQGMRTINIEGLYLDTEYSLEMRAITNKGKIIESNEFTFKTSNKPYLRIVSSETSTSSVSVQFEVFTEINSREDQELTWEIYSNINEEEVILNEGNKNFSTSGIYNINISGMPENTDLIFKARYYFESIGEVLITESLKTKSNDSERDKGYITSHSFKSHDYQTLATFNISGNIMFFEYKTESSSWSELIFTSLGNNRIEVLIPTPIENLDIASFRINYQHDSIYKVNNLSSPEIPVIKETNWTFILTLIFSILFGLIVIFAILYASYLKWMKQRRSRHSYIFNKKIN